jgi:hypothetical protein
VQARCRCGGAYATHRLETELGEGAPDGGAGLSARERERKRRWPGGEKPADDLGVVKRGRAAKLGRGGLRGTGHDGRAGGALCRCTRVHGSGAKHDALELGDQGRSPRA